MLTRSGGHVGDDIYVTGTLGDSSAGITLILERSAAPQGSAAAALKERFYRPAPRVGAGLALGPLATAAIDISDGLLADLAHICKASGCGATIDVERVPLSAELLSLFRRRRPSRMRSAAARLGVVFHGAAVAGRRDRGRALVPPARRALRASASSSPSGARVPARRRAVHAGRARLSPLLTRQTRGWARCATRFTSSPSGSAPASRRSAPGTFGSMVGLCRGVVAARAAASVGASRSWSRSIVGTASGSAARARGASAATTINASSSTRSRACF